MNEKVDARRILVLMDPSQEKHPALRRACINAEKRKEKPTLILFMGVDRELHELRGAKPILYRDPKWFAGIVERIKAPGAPYEIAVSWSNDWAESAVDLAKRENCDRILAPVSVGQDRGHIITDELWKLLRTAPVPVTLVHPGQSEERNNFLVALKRSDKGYAKLDAEALSRGRELAEIYGAKLHIINIFSDSTSRPDRAQLIREFGIPNDQLHIYAGDPAEEIAKVAEKIKADMLILGVKHRTGIAATLRGNTISKILRKLNCDVTAVV